MTKGNFPVEKFESIETPFYYYDTELLRQTLKTINDALMSVPPAWLNVWQKTSTYR